MDASEGSVTRLAEVRAANRWAANRWAAIRRTGPEKDERVCMIGYTVIDA